MGCLKVKIPLLKNDAVLNFSWLEWVLLVSELQKSTLSTQYGGLTTLFFYVMIHLFQTFIWWRKLQNVLSNFTIGTLTVKKNCIDKPVL